MGHKKQGSFNGIKGTFMKFINREFKSLMGCMNNRKENSVHKKNLSCYYLLHVFLIFQLFFLPNLAFAKTYNELFYKKYQEIYLKHKNPNYSHLKELLTQLSEKQQKDFLKLIEQDSLAKTPLIRIELDKTNDILWVFFQGKTYRSSILLQDPALVFIEKQFFKTDKKTSVTDLYKKVSQMNLKVSYSNGVTNCIIPNTWLCLIGEVPHASAQLEMMAGGHPALHLLFLLVAFSPMIIDHFKKAHKRERQHAFKVGDIVEDLQSEAVTRVNCKPTAETDSSKSAYINKPPIPYTIEFGAHYGIKALSFQVTTASGTIPCRFVPQRRSSENFVLERGLNPICRQYFAPTQDASPVARASFDFYERLLSWGLPIKLNSSPNENKLSRAPASSGEATTGEGGSTQAAEASASQPAVTATVSLDNKEEITNAVKSCCKNDFCKKKTLIEAADPGTDQPDQTSSPSDATI